jgi:phage terminase Nu1 subunit (DNA packaging protein)
MAKLVGRAEVARIFARSPRWVSKLVDQGMPREACGQYDLAKCMLWYIRHLQKELERRELTPDSTPLRRERLRLVKAQADREEYELRQRRSQLIPIDVYEAERAARVNRVETVLLALPDAVAPELEGRTRSVIKSKLDAAVRQALTTLSKGRQG